MPALAQQAVDGHEAVNALLTTIPASRLPGCNGRLASSLAAAGIQSAADLGQWTEARAVLFYQYLHWLAVLFDQYLHWLAAVPMVTTGTGAHVQRVGRQAGARCTAAAVGYGAGPQPSD